MKEKHDIDGAGGMECCVYCIENLPHPKLARGESYSCGYKPYRCDLCKYSTTTKGNLSIHMQSDKHLNAVQESIPTSAVGHHASFAFGTPAGISQDSLPSTSGMIPTIKFAPVANGGAGVRSQMAADGQWEIFDCLICCSFSTSDLHSMLEHLEVDRSGIPPAPGDIQVFLSVIKLSKAVQTCTPNSPDGPRPLPLQPVPIQQRTEG